MDIIALILLLSLLMFRKFDIALIILILSLFRKFDIALISLLSLHVFSKFDIALILVSFLFFRKLSAKNRIQSINALSTSSGSGTDSESSDSDSDVEGGEYEVFLSFCGSDTRKGFTDFLYTFLRIAGVCTFRDNEELRVGEEIGPELLEAIKQSKISVPIFSKNYAYSKWCMLELVQMVECKTNEGQKIFPIFYDVEPYDVRHQTGSYEKAFRQHKKNLDKKIVQQWKDALKMVGKLKGLELKKETDGHEGELAKKVVKKVLQKLKKSQIHLPKILVGMEHHTEKMEELLNLNSDCVRIVGIHGMGGIGKTTIAKVVYNQLCELFDFCSFLENVRGKSQYPNGLVKLQSQLISNLAKGKFSNIVDVEDGSDKIKNVVKGKKVLIVLDDVDEKSQFDTFVGDSNLFGLGSRIIVTTRNKEVLNVLEETYEKKGLLEVYRSYEPPLMNSDHSLQLFSNHAFNQSFPPEDYVILARDIASTAAGLPLALESIGLSLFGDKDKASWKEKLREREKIPHEVVLRTLRRSFEALNDRQQHIFLDIACLFIGEDNMVPSYMWRDCELNPINAINANILRSLIKVKDDDSLWMHDQLRDFGREIVREENFKHPGKRSRLWRPEEALDIFDRCLGTINVEALCLDFIREEQESRPNFLVGENFGKLQNLLFLRVGSIDFKGDFKRLFSSLRWLQWKPLGNISPTNCELKNLVILDLSESQITDDWEGWSQIKRSEKLKVLNLSKCEGLRRAPDFSTFKSLERLILGSCLTLGEIVPSIRNLINLRVLDLSNCFVLRGTLDCSQIATLEYLDVHSCLQLSGLAGFEPLVTLRYLNTSGCHNLERLPNLSHLRTLKKLSTLGCQRLIEIQGLDILESLEQLDISDCINIKNLPNISNLVMLKEIILSGCVKLAEVEGIRELKSLETLDMSWCTSLENIPDLSNLKNLKKLKLGGFENLTEIQGLEELKSLELLNISGWKSIECLPDLSNLKNIREIDASHCVKLTQLQGLEELKFFELLDINGCESIENLPDLSNVKRLKEIKAFRCVKLSAIRGLEALESLTLLSMWPKTSQPNLVPPEVLSQLRRKKKARHTKNDEHRRQAGGKLSKKRTILSCRNCGNSGHNARTCKGQSEVSGSGTSRQKCKVRRSMQEQVAPTQVTQS
ncbi:hypothetical protein LguiB_010632 [Lonicera macranthoides]